MNKKKDKNKLTLRHNNAEYKVYFLLLLLIVVVAPTSSETE